MKRFLRETWPVLILIPVLLAVPHDWKLEALWRYNLARDSWRGEGASLAPIVPSAAATIEALLDDLSPGTDDLLIDIGSGDGRIVIAAARRGARGVGIERRHALVETARRNAREAGVDHLTHFLLADAMDMAGTVSQATIVTMYLSPTGSAVLGPWLDEVMGPDAVIASITFPLPDVRPDRVLRIETPGLRPMNVFIYGAGPPPGRGCDPLRGP